MRIILILLAILIVAFVSLLPMYLGPNDIGSCERPTGEEPCLRTDAIVVVSGGDTNARTDEGIALYKDGWADLIIFSGAAADPSGPSNAEAMRLRAIERGVPSEAILTEELSRTTTENAANTSLFIEEKAITRILLVTSSYHQRRANLEFQYFLGERVVIVDHPAPNDRQWPALWWLHSESVYLALAELIKIGLFFLRGPAET